MASLCYLPQDSSVSLGDINHITSLAASLASSRSNSIHPKLHSRSRSLSISRVSGGLQELHQELGLGSLEAPQGASESGIVELSAYLTCCCFGTAKEYRRSLSRGLMRIVIGEDDSERRALGSEQEVGTGLRCKRIESTRLCVMGVVSRS